MNPQPDERALAVLARETGIAPERLQALHDEEWQRLDRAARIKAFLPLLVMKHLRERCHHLPPPA